MTDLPAYILSGGRSTRFGSDKARALLGGRPLLSRMTDQAHAAGATKVFAVAREAGAYDELGVETLADVRPGLGPLSGLEAALTHRGEGWLLLLTCDQLACAPAWVGRLAESALAPEAFAAVFHDGARFQPVPGLYHTRLLPQVSALLGSGAKASFQNLLASASGVVKIAMPADWPEKLQANTPEDLPVEP